MAAPHIEAIPATTPFIGPEQLMRERGLRTMLRLGANESSFGPSPKAVAAMAAELPRLSWYGDPESFALRDALAARHGCSIENISIGSGIDDLMGLAVRAFTSPGSIALTTRGTYPTFAYHVTGYGASLETVSYAQDGTVDTEALARRAREVRPAIVYVCNPDNPSGTLLSAKQIEALFEALPPATLMMLDEAYIDFAPQAEPHRYLLHPRLLVLRTFSKAYGLAGARIGYTIAAARHVETFEKIRLQYGVNRNAQIGALAALRDEAFHASVIAGVAQGREEYYALARELGRRAIASCTNFVCIDFDTAEKAANMVAALVARGVFIRKPGAAPLDRYIRVSVGTAPERAEFAERLRDAAAEVAAA